jgi:hypothetical protein
VRLDASFIRRGSMDVGAVRRKLDAVNPAYWSDAVSRTFEAHALARHLFLMNDLDARHYHGTAFPLFDYFIDDLAVLFACVAECCGRGGHLIRLQFARLDPGAAVGPHTDKTVTLTHSHRIHVPIVTNPACAFECGGETVNMKVGEIWDFDNTRPHAAHNGGSTPRIHLIADWAAPLPLDRWPRYLAERAGRKWRGYVALNRRVIEQARALHRDLEGRA